jgi:glyoxylase-like metal-dependent hydrolase (beta-lactamase superfamily II)
MHRILIALLLVAAAASARAQDVVRTGDIGKRGLSNSDFPRITRVAPNVYGYEQVDPTKRIVTVNNLIVVTNQGVVVCDGQGTVENTKRLVADIAMLTPQPIKYVIIGSEHGDHRGGDAAFPPTAIFVAKPQTILLGGTELQVLNIGRAHTGHDLVTYLPREKLLFMSEVFINRIFPSMANSNPSEWVQTLKRAEAMDVAVYVPAHGFIDSPKILNEEEHTYRLAIERVIAEGKRLHDAGVPIADAPTRADFGPYSDWTRRSENAAGALQRVYMELDGELK